MFRPRDPCRRSIAVSGRERLITVDAEQLLHDARQRQVRARKRRSRRAESGLASQPALSGVVLCSPRRLSASAEATFKTRRAATPRSAARRPRPPARRCAPVHAPRCRRRTSPTSGASAPSARTRHGAAPPPAAASVSVATSRLLNPRPGKPRLDLLEQPAVAVGIAERREREVGRARWGRDPARGRSSRRRAGGCSKWNTSLTSAPRRDELGACRLDVGRRRGTVPWTEPGAAVVMPLAEA